MKAFLGFLILTAAAQAQADSSAVRKLAVGNGYAPSASVIRAISKAAQAYNVDPQVMAAIAIVETGIGKFTKTRKNKNGTSDVGLFQINDVNKPACAEYKLETNEGSAMCAAKLLARLKRKWPLDYYARYHSHTAQFRDAYKQKVANVLQRGYYGIKVAKRQ